MDNFLRSQFEFRLLPKFFYDNPRLLIFNLQSGNAILHNMISMMCKNALQENPYSRDDFEVSFPEPVGDINICKIIPPEPEYIGLCYFIYLLYDDNFENLLYCTVESSDEPETVVICTQTSEGQRMVRSIEKLDWNNPDGMISCCRCYLSYFVGECSGDDNDLQSIITDKKLKLHNIVLENYNFIFKFNKKYEDNLFIDNSGFQIYAVAGLCDNNDRICGNNGRDENCIFIYFITQIIDMYMKYIEQLSGLSGRYVRDIRFYPDDSDSAYATIKNYFHDNRFIPVFIFPKFPRYHTSPPEFCGIAKDIKPINRNAIIDTDTGRCVVDFDKTHFSMGNFGQLSQQLIDLLDDIFLSEYQDAE